ncbi:uncharacterized protein C8Q71DRAFT_396402 [Rhodofomes roseus]|uniref:Homeobox domain-containing protein n=1 Tax=Rhodofomes roseus TaxID=34475 RepID=A0ABQ8JZC5_9APHY|nr:uncharacterized protein C8Q71DRAFT_396402 [Rhodofomes roseus]KAH9829657.1 hypothetical protein C8Q71DRAFT_396402 [Rhodofomes roseus]
MLDTAAPLFDVQPLNSYNVAQLRYAFEDGKSLALDALPDAHAVPFASPLFSAHDYDARRMSTSATSDSSLQSRPEKRGPSPSSSPLPKRSRPDISLDPNAWSNPNTPSPHPPTEPEERPDADPARVQLPSLASTFQDRYERRASLPTLYSDNPASRLRLPPPGHRPSQSSSGLASYQFPNSDSIDSTRSSAIYDYPASGLSQSGSSSSYNFSPLQTDYSRSSGLSSSISSESDWSAGGIVRPNSTPGNLAGVPGLKYDDALRHPSLGSQDLFGGVTRISGHHASTDRSARQSSGIKSEEWSFPSNDFNMNPPSSAPSYPSTPSTSASAMTSSAPNMSGTSSPNRSPQSASAASLVERPPRKRGKLPKPVTDFLKDWLHRHSDHPYPSEEEKKQLCNATGLSMSQVSNWMINARRRILAPAHRAAQGPTTTTPFSSRPGPGVVPSVLDTGRRASMPTDSLQLYYPMSLQSLGGDPHMPASTRHMVSMSRSLSSSNATAGSLSQGHHGHGSSPYALDGGYSTSHSRMGYGSSGLSHGHSSHGSSGYGMGMSMSSSSGLSGSSSFLGSSQNQLYGHSSGGYTQSPQSGTRMTIQQEDSQARYTFPDHSVSPQPGPGSGYGTPQ